MLALLLGIACAAAVVLLGWALRMRRRYRLALERAWDREAVVRGELMEVQRSSKIAWDLVDARNAAAEAHELRISSGALATDIHFSIGGYSPIVKSLVLRRVGGEWLAEMTVAVAPVDVRLVAHDAVGQRSAVLLEGFSIDDAYAGEAHVDGRRKEPEKVVLAARVGQPWRMLSPFPAVGPNSARGKR